MLKVRKCYLNKQKEDTRLRWVQSMTNWLSHVDEFKKGWSKSSNADKMVCV